MSSPPVIDPIPSYITRLNFGARTWAFKAVTTAFFSTYFNLAPSVRKYAPTYIKKYPVRPTLECRFFIPQSFKAGSSLPIYIDIHGGGFFAGQPRMDDMICHYLCNTFNLLVVSIEYRLAPSYPFPIPVDDCAEVALAVLSDPDLPTDHNKVAMGGQSAGGNLVLTASQDPRLRTKVKAVVSFYPATDFSHRFTGDYRDKPAGPDGKGAVRDGLRSVVDPAQWAYVPFEQDRTDPRLSPVYAHRSALPDHIYIIAAQYDKLCEEAFQIAKRLAGDIVATEEENFDINGIRWERVPDEVHGFLESGWQKPWTKEVEDVFSRVGQWLDHVFTTK